MKRLTKILSFLLLTLMLFNNSISVLAASIGEQLPSCETGWQRIEESNSSFSYTASAWGESKNDGYSGGAMKFTTPSGANVKFNFTGTKLRIISTYWPNSYATQVDVYIDGIKKDTFSVRSASQYRVLVSDISGLSDKEHYVKIVNISGGEFDFDAVDIGQDCEIKPYSENFLSAPSTLTATSEDTKVLLKWDAVDEATSYTIKYGTESGNYTDFQTVSGATYSQEVTGLDNGHTYYFAVSASNGTLESANSNEVSAIPQVAKPTSPLGLTATAGNGQVTLSWSLVTGADSYNVKRSPTQGGPYDDTVGSSVYGSFTDQTVSNGTTYYYVVSAVNAGGESADSNEVSATPKDDSNKLKLVLEVNQEKQLSVSEDLSYNNLMTWTSSDTSIATVDQNGKVKALKPGNTVITSTSKDGSYTEIINVLVVDLEYQLAVDLTIGEYCRFTVNDLTNTANVTWTSNDSTIATVSNKGKVTAVSEGLTYITATDEQAKEIGRIYVRVRI